MYKLVAPLVKENEKLKVVCEHGTSSRVACEEMYVKQQSKVKMAKTRMIIIHFTLQSSFNVQIMCNLGEDMLVNHSQSPPFQLQDYCMSNSAK